MTQYDNTNRGALFPNDRKTRDNQPDYRGSLDVNGVDHWVSAWVKSTAKGEILSLSIEPKDQQGGRPQSSQPRANGPRTLGGGQNQGHRDPNPNATSQAQNEPPMDFDDDIPF